MSERPPVSGKPVPKPVEQRFVRVGFGNVEAEPVSLKAERTNRWLKKKARKNKRD